MEVSARGVAEGESVFLGYKASSATSFSCSPDKGVKCLLKRCPFFIYSRAIPERSARNLREGSPASLPSSSCAHTETCRAEGRLANHIYNYARIERKRIKDRGCKKEMERKEARVTGPGVGSP